MSLSGKPWVAVSVEEARDRSGVPPLLRLPIETCRFLAAGEVSGGDPLGLDGRGLVDIDLETGDSELEEFEDEEKREALRSSRFSCCEGAKLRGRESEESPSSSSSCIAATSLTAWCCESGGEREGTRP